VNTIVTESVDEAAAIIRRGGLVAFPTETVYGLGADVFNVGAVQKIFEAKQRPADNPLIAHIASLEQIEELAAEVTESGGVLIRAFFPGPLTIVLRKSARVPTVATAGLDTIGIRMPKAELARRFLSACTTPVVAPSANISGRPSPTTWEAVVEDLDGGIDCILRGEPTEIGLESTVVECTGAVPILLRQGSISLDELRRVIPVIERVSALSAEIAKSPGLRHRHYSPRARIKIVDERTRISNFLYAGGRFGYIGLRAPAEQFSAVKICRSLEDYARSLFEFFRECDRQGIEEIYCEAVSQEGIGAALMDRLVRAAEDGR